MRIQTVLFFLSIAILFSSCKREKSTVPIPYDADFAARINSQEIITQIAKEKISDFSFSDLFKSSDEDTTQKVKGIQNLLKNIQEAGLDLLEDIWVYRKNEQTAIVVSIDDLDKFKEFLIHQVSDRTYFNGKKNAIIQEDVSIVWNDERTIFLLTESVPDTSQLFSLLDQNKRNFNPLIKKEDQKKEILLWSNNHYLKRQFPEEYQKIISSDSFSLTSIDFQDGIILIENSKLLAGDNKIFQPTSFDSKIFDQYLFSFGLSLNPKELPLSSDVIGTYQLSTCISGSCFLKVDSIRQQTKIFKTVELDEEFNTVEKIDSIIEWYPSFTVHLPVINMENAARLLQHFEKKGLLIAERNYYRLTLGYFPVYVSLHEGAIHLSDRLSDKPPGKFSYVSSGKEAKESFLFSGNNLNQHKHGLNLNLSTLEKFSLIAAYQKEKLVLNGTVNFTEKDRYALLSFIDLIKNSSNTLLP